jgi:GNAT superfamily N-acetyltransferase
MKAEVVKWGDVVGELSRLFPLHWEEAGLGGAFCVNYPAYRNAAASGGLVVVVVKDEGKIVGYWTLLVAPLLHNLGLRAAHTDMVFVHPLWRSRGAFAKLYEMVEKTLLDKGVDVWFVGAKVKSQFGKILSRKGFVAEETAYMKRMPKDG